MDGLHFFSISPAEIRDSEVGKVSWLKFEVESNKTCSARPLYNFGLGASNFFFSLTYYWTIRYLFKEKSVIEIRE